MQYLLVQYLLVQYLLVQYLLVITYGCSEVWVYEVFGIKEKQLKEVCLH